MTTTRLTRLDAINECLKGIGIAPVQSEDVSEAASALSTVNNASKVLQAEGWWFNKEYNWKIAPNAEGKIAVPANILDIVEWNTSRNADLTERGGFIYDKYEHTFDLEDAVTAEGTIEFVFIVELPFSDLPEAAKLAVVYIAKRMYSQDEEADSTTHQMQSADEQRALAALYKMDMKHTKRNYFHNTTNAGNISRIAGYNSITVGTKAYPKRDS